MTTEAIQGFWEEYVKYLWAFCFMIFVGVAAASAQVGGGALSNQPQIFNIPSHPERAAVQTLSREESLFEGSTVTTAKGELPLWDTPQKVTYVMPLGDVARFYRREHEAAKKAALVKEN
jgi:hypothetical protein